MHHVLFAIVLIIAGAVSRIIPHPPNVAAVAAMALVGGMYLDHRVSLVLPLGAMVLSDAIIGFHGLTGFVYGGFVLTGLVGVILRKSPRIPALIGGSIAGSLLFYIVTNAGVWLAGDGTTYPGTLEGLVACYAAAIPFFRNSLIGDLIYTGLLAGVFEMSFRFGLHKSMSRLRI